MDLIKEVIMKIFILLVFCLSMFNAFGSITGSYASYNAHEVLVLSEGSNADEIILKLYDSNMDDPLSPSGRYRNRATMKKSPPKYSGANDIYVSTNGKFVLELSRAGAKGSGGYRQVLLWMSDTKVSEYDLLHRSPTEYSDVDYLRAVD